MPNTLLQVASQRNLENGLPVGNSKSPADLDDGSEGKPTGDTDSFNHKQCCFSKLWKKDKALFVDKFSRVAFPLSFAIFNTIYWVVYLVLL